MPGKIDMQEAQLKSIVDGEDPQDVATVAQTQKIPRVFKGGVQQTQVKEWVGSAPVLNGIVNFNLTDENGDAIFQNIYKESLRWWIDDLLTQYQLGGYELSADRKTLTLSVNRLGIVLLGIIQFVTAVNGTTVYLQIKGD